MKTRLDKILPNPSRDFGINPIDEEQVTKLIASISDVGFLGGVTVRPHPTKKGHYQTGCGHNRIEALRRCGIVDADLICLDFDDDMMVAVMVAENGTQRGMSMAAATDSVAAITRRVAYVMLSTDFATDVAKWFPNQKSFDSSKGRLLKGEGLGERLIRKFAPEGCLTTKEVRTAIATLKDSGTIAKILHGVEAQIEREARAAEKELKEATTDGKKKAAKYEAEKKRAAAKKATQAAEVADAAPVLFDETCLQEFDTQLQFETFRSRMSKPDVVDLIPVENQRAVAQKIMKSARKDGGQITEERVRSLINHEIKTAMGFQNEADEEARRAFLMKFEDEAIREIFHKLDKTLQTSLSHAVYINSLYAKWLKEQPGKPVFHSEATAEVFVELMQEMKPIVKGVKA